MLCISWKWTRRKLDYWNHGTFDPNILHMFRFRSGKVTPVPNIYWKRRHFPAEFQARNTFWSAPSWRDGISGPASCLRGPVPSSPLASTAAPLESRSSAASTWPLTAATWSGVTPQALSPGPSAAVSGVGRRGRRRGNDESCRQLSSTGSTDCFGLNIFKTVQSKIFSRTKWTSFNTSFL